MQPIDGVNQYSDLLSYCEVEEQCECKVHRATKVLSEQYLQANVSFYRACQDEDGNILSEEECNRGDGTLIPIQDVPNQFIFGGSANPYNSHNHTSPGWEDFGYFDNVINVYLSQFSVNFTVWQNSGGVILEGIESGILEVDTGLNGFARRRKEGVHQHRGIFTRHDTLFDIDQEGNPLNWSTFAHELGHTWDLNHLFDATGEDVDMVDTDCNSVGDRICDTEPSPKYHQSVYYSDNDSANIDVFFESEDFGTHLGLSLEQVDYNLQEHTYCVFRGKGLTGSQLCSFVYDDSPTTPGCYYDQEADTLYLGPSDSDWTTDPWGKIYGTRDLDWALDVDTGTYIVDNLLLNVVSNRLPASCILFFP